MSLFLNKDHIFSPFFLVSHVLRTCRTIEILRYNIIIITTATRRTRPRLTARRRRTFVLQVCEHNTIGPQCNECAIGYYGNAMAGTPDDCKKCACPLEEDVNNFSPTCKADADGGFACTNCPEGYAGDRCEMYVQSCRSIAVLLANDCNSNVSVSDALRRTTETRW